MLPGNEPVAHGGDVDGGLGVALAALVSEPADQVELGANKQQNRGETGDVSELQNPASACVCFHGATLAPFRAGVLIDKL